MLESLSGASVDVVFLSFDEVLEHGIPEDIDVIINAGDAHTAFSGGDVWKNEKLISMMREWIYNGGGFVGIGEPTAVENGGRFFQLADALGVDKELGFTLHTDKYFHTPLASHFITEDVVEELDFGEGMRNIYALNENTEIISYSNGEKEEAFILLVFHTARRIHAYCCVLSIMRHIKKKNLKNGMRITSIVKFMHTRITTCMQF